MSNYPASQDDNSTLPNPIAGNFTTAPDHAVLHSTENDAIKALEAKLGTSASTSTNNTFLIGNGSGTSIWSNLTSAQLAARISDETGSGSAVFGTSPVITTPTGIVKGDVGLSNVDNTSDSTKNAASVALTNHTIDASLNTLLNIPISSIATNSGAWASWIPAFTNWTIGTGGSALTDARYTQIGKLVSFSLNSILGSSGQSVTGSVSFTLPVAPRAISGNSFNIGSALMLAGGSTLATGIVSLFNSSTVLTVMGAAGTYVSSIAISSTVPATWAAGDSIRVTGTYEAA
jgi:hypothetical protein